MTDTTPIARFLTRQAADDAAELLRANAIRCAVVDPPMHLVDPLYPGLREAGYHTIVVADDDAETAREALAGFLDAAWFLRAQDGRRTHAFETATAERLRRHAATDADPDTWVARDCRHLAGRLDAARAPQVAALFRHQRTVEGRTLAEWAHACGCEPVEPP
ncbi:MAG TPA: hypothetical protein VN615_15215 [Gaiellales bacterium]|nr:hypothetical protein [Gaiellales bacterium]